MATLRMTAGHSRVDFCKNSNKLNKREEGRVSENNPQIKQRVKKILVWFDN
jgi:hypothetical protein